MRFIPCLLAALALAACDKSDQAADASADITDPSAVTAGWNRLGDGSFFRLSVNPYDPDRHEADRCWPAGEGYECLGADDIRLPVGRIVVANRTYVNRLPTTTSVGASTGFSCAVYGGPVIEQRVVSDETGLLTNDSLDGTLWGSGEVERLSRAGDRPPEGGYLDCMALAPRIRGSLSGIGAADFEKADIMPPLAQKLAPTAA